VLPAGIELALGKVLKRVIDPGLSRGGRGDPQQEQEPAQQANHACHNAVAPPVRAHVARAGFILLSGRHRSATPPGLWDPLQLGRLSGILARESTKMPRAPGARGLTSHTPTARMASWREA